MKKVILKCAMNRAGENIPAGSTLCLGDEEAEKLVSAGNAKFVKAETKTVKADPEAEKAKAEPEAEGEKVDSDAKSESQHEESEEPQQVKSEVEPQEDKPEEKETKTSGKSKK